MTSFDGLKAIRLLRRIALAVVALLIVTVGAPPLQVSAAGTFSATIDPAEDVCNHDKVYTITVKNETAGSKGIGRIKITIPAGYSGVKDWTFGGRAFPKSVIVE